MSGNYHRKPKETDMTAKAVATPERSCRRCTYWDQTGASTAGWCRVNPPVQLSEIYRLGTNWPPTNADDWCGRFEVRVAGRTPPAQVELVVAPVEAQVEPAAAQVEPFDPQPAAALALPEPALASADPLDDGEF
jgi:hypothetical protein